MTERNHQILLRQVKTLAQMANEYKVRHGFKGFDIEYLIKDGMWVVDFYGPRSVSIHSSTFTKIEKELKL